MTGEAFSYGRALAPLMWAFAAIVALELIVVHILVLALWSRLAAWILSALSFATLVWVVLLIRSFPRLPVLVDAEGTIMRVGSLTSIYVPKTHIGGLRTSWPSTALKERGVLNFALINYPNVMLDLDPPLPGRRRAVHAVAHCLDDPAGFAKAIERLLEARA